MSNWVFLKKILEGNQEFSRRYIEFEPGIGKISFTSDVTGTKEIQIAEPEKKLGWHPFMHEGNIYLMPDKVPNFVIRLGGEKGGHNLFKISAGYAEIYSNEKYQAIGARLTKSIFESMPEWMQEGKNFILADEYICKEQQTKVSGVWLVGEEGTPQGKALFVEHGNFYYEMNVEVHMMPLIQIPSYTMVQVDLEKDGTAPEKALKIRVASNTEIVRQSVLDMVERSEELNRRIREELNKLK